MSSGTGNYDFSNWTFPEGLSETTCHRKPTMFCNGGYTISGSYTEILSHPTTLLAFQLFVVFSLHYLFYYPLRLLKLPPLVFQVTTGAVIGALLNEDTKQSVLLHDDASDVLKSLMTMGHILFIFSVAVKMDVSTIHKSGINAWVIGILSTLAPVLVTTGGIQIMYNFWFVIYEDKNVVPPNLDNFAFLHSVTQFVVIVSLLIDLKILNSELGRLSSAASLINYCASIGMQWVLNVWRMYNTFTKIQATENIIMSVGFVVSTVAVGWTTSKWIIDSTPEGKPIDQSKLFQILGLVGLVSFFSDRVGLEYRFGPFLLGLVVPSGPPIASTVARKLDSFISGMLMPLFMTYAGYRMNLGNWKLTRGYLWASLYVFLLSFVAKVAVIVLPARLYYKMPYRDAFVVCLILCAKGSIEITLYAISISKNQMNDEVHTVGTASFVVMAIVVPVVVSLLYDPSRKYSSYQRRNILNTQREVQLHIVTCIHRQDDAVAMVNLLHVCDMTKGNPLCIHVLHLVKLVGRATPLFIDHQWHNKKQAPRSSPLVKHITDLFYFYKNHSAGSPVEVHVFTSLSPHIFMHDDICTLAFDKVASLILLPFHKKWNAKGMLILEDRSLREINARVLEQAPCSVGVLIDRHKVLAKPSMLMLAKTLYHVAVLFLGSEDDREALALGRQMARSPHVQLTIVQVMAAQREGEDGWEKMLNAELLKGIMLECSASGNVFFKEEVVTDSSQTIAVIRMLESKFDLVVVGCHHKKSAVTMGLEEWTEFPELGQVGDIMASSDVQDPVSVLVVQQHKFKANALSLIGRGDH